MGRSYFLVDTENLSQEAFLNVMLSFQQDKSLSDKHFVLFFNENSSSYKSRSKYENLLAAFTDNVYIKLVETFETNGLDFYLVSALGLITQGLDPDIPESGGADNYFIVSDDQGFTVSLDYFSNTLAMNFELLSQDSKLTAENIRKPDLIKRYIKEKLISNIPDIHDDKDLFSELFDLIYHSENDDDFMDTFSSIKTTYKYFDILKHKRLLLESFERTLVGKDEKYPHSLLNELNQLLGRV